MMLERKIYDLVERVSAEERGGEFGRHLLSNLFASFADDLGIVTAELWKQSKQEARRLETLGADRPTASGEWAQLVFKRHRRTNPSWHIEDETGVPVAMISFGKKQRSWMVFYFSPDFFGDHHPRVEETLRLMARLVTMFVQKHEDRHQLHEILSLSMRQQQRVLSPAPADFPGFEVYGCSLPSEEVGGDYFNLESLNPDLLSVTIADAKGKGFIAAVQVTALHRCLRLLHREPLKITAKMSRLNQAFIEAGDDQDPISAVLGELHGDGRFLYVNASHPYPILRKGRELRELSDGGVFLGLLPDSCYRFGMVQLEPGDLLCLYTDGVSESERGDLDHLPRIKEILLQADTLPLPELAQSILDLSHSPEYQDDRTLVLIRRL